MNLIKFIDLIVKIKLMHGVTLFYAC